MNFISVAFSTPPFRPSLAGQCLVTFSLDEKVTKESRLPNLCSFHHGKSLERNPSRVTGSAIIKCSATLLRIADVHRSTKEVQKDLPGSNPNIQRPDLLGGSAGLRAPTSFMLTIGSISQVDRCWLCCLLPHHKEQWKCREIRKSVAVNKR